MSGVSRTNCSKLLNVRTVAMGIIRSISPRSPMQVSVLASIMAISGMVSCLQDVFRDKVTKTIYIKRKGDETKFSFPE